MLCGLATATPQGLPQELQPLWDSMTLEEKVGQMIMVYMSPPDFVIENNLGGVLVMGAHLSTRNQLQKNLKNIASRAKIPLLVTIDQEGGHVNRIRNLDRKWEKAPSAKEMREMAPEKIEQTAREIGATLKKTGINLNLAPAIDPPSDINGRETFMELHGRSWGGIKIRENVAPFKALAPDAPVIMMSSVRYTKISDAPAVFEPKIVKMAHDIDDDIVVLTDDLWGTNLRAWISGPEAPLPNPYPASEFKKVVKAALDAGNDMFMTTYPTKAVDMKNTLLELARQSDDYLVRIEKSVARILKMKFRAGLLTSH